MKTYLELSVDEALGSAHKFYEVMVEDTTLIIRYGRIGTSGSSSTKVFPTEALALKEAAKKIKSKKRKGYEEAVQGVRKKRTITRRAISSTRSTAKKAPVLWKFQSGSPAFGIYIDDNYCWVGNEKGRIFKLNHQGQVENQFQLPDGVKAIIIDEGWIYVGCDDGNVYDLTGKLPRLAYEINENIDIYWLDVNNGLLAVSDKEGNVTVINAEDEEQWNKKSKGNSGWMVRCDRAGRVYHGHSKGVTCYYGWDGSIIWDKKTKGAVLFGWKSEETVTAGTSQKEVIIYDKEGKLLVDMAADRAVFSCATAPNNEYIFAGDSSSSIYCFDKSGKRLWKLGTTCGSAYSMQYHNEKVYIVTTDGSLACIDASEAAIESAKTGTVPQIQTIKAPKAVAVIQTDILESTTDLSVGVELVCVKKGGKLRMRVVSPGYQSDWNVQFPKNLRILGQHYRVDKIEEANQGGFYRYQGNIYKVD